MTQDDLKSVLDYDEVSGEFKWRLRVNRCVAKGDVAGTINDQGYCIISIQRVRYRAHRLAFLYMAGYLPENEVDHIDNVRNNNAWDNIREVSRSCNMINTGNMCTNTSGVKGVQLFRRTGKWRASIGHLKKERALGYYWDFADAVCARYAGEQCLGHDSCNSNSPAKEYVTKYLNKNKQENNL